MISVVMCTYNRLEQLKKGLWTILDQQTIPDEIILIDDGSTDGTKEFFATFNNPTEVHINYIYLNDHPGPRISCYPRNVGIKQAKGDILIFTEPEALHVDNTIKQLLDKMTEYPYNTILASQVWTMGKRIWETVDQAYFEKAARLLNHPYAMLTEANMQNTNAPDSDWAITGEKNCNAGVLFALKREWIFDLGGFDESFYLHGNDDFTLYDRLALYGRGVKKFSDIAVIHQWHEKNYPGNIYEAAEKNGKLAQEQMKNGEYRVNIGKEWGKL